MADLLRAENLFLEQSVHLQMTVQLRLIWAPS